MGCNEKGALIFLKEGKREKVKGQEQTVTRQVQKGAVREEANEPQAPL